MQLNISGHTKSSTFNVKELIETTLARLVLRFPTLTNVYVIVDKKSKFKAIEISTLFEGGDVSIKGKGESIQIALRKANERFIRVLDSRKGALIRQRQSITSTNDDYIVHEKIQEMKLP